MLFDFLFDLRRHPPDCIDDAFQFDVNADTLNLFSLSLDILSLPHNLVQIGIEYEILMRIRADATYLLF